MTTPEPAQTLAPIIHLDDGGNPYAAGYRCGTCGEVFMEEHRGCPKCATVGSLQPHGLSRTGKLYAYTIVHRSFPGIKTPFISAIVELDGGGYLKGNLEGVEPVPERLVFDMAVQIDFDRLTSRDGDQDQLLRFIFRPLEADSHPEEVKQA